MSIWVKSTEMSSDTLWESFSETRNDKIREKLLFQYLPLVKHIAGGIIGKLPASVSIDELIDAGVIGLLESIDRYDTKASVKFETYAFTRVRGAMMDELRKMDWAPRSLREKTKRLDEAHRVLAAKLGRQPSQEEIAEHLEITLEKFHQLTKEVIAVNPISFDQEIFSGSGESTNLYDVVEERDAITPMKSLEDKELKSMVVEEIENLPKNEKLVIALYYYEELTLREIGEILNLSESRVSQIHSKVVKKLKTALTF